MSLRTQDGFSSWVPTARIELELEGRRIFSLMLTDKISKVFLKPFRDLVLRVALDIKVASGNQLKLNYVGGASQLG